MYDDLYTLSYLTKHSFPQFDIAQWLVERKPRLVERSQIIELTGKALTTAGLTPPEDTLMLYGVRNMLCSFRTGL